MTLAERSRYAPAMLLAVVLAGVGVVAGNPVALFAAVIPLALVGYGALVVEPPTDALTVEREFSEQSPRPGEPVTVQLRLTNESERYLPDVRVVDGVPDEVAVIDGSPRGHVTLGPAESTTLTYEVRVPRGTHEFEPATVAVRSLAGTAERRTTTEGVASVQTTVETDPLPLHGQTAGIAGRIETDDAGSGIAFHSSREYRPGDPINRVDWNRYASTGELSTVEFHEEKAATVVLVVDDRPPVRAVARPGELDAGARARDAARELAGALLDAGDRVGVAVKDSGGGFVPPRDDTTTLRVSPAQFRGEEEGYLPPRGAGAAQETACRRYLDRRAERPSRLPLRIEGFWFAGELADHVPDDAQIVLCSPLTDDEPVEAAETWIARGHAVTVVSPDPTPDTVGGRVETIRRRERRNELGRAGARVVDWDGTDTLDAAVERAEATR